MIGLGEDRCDSCLVAEPRTDANQSLTPLNQNTVAPMFISCSSLSHAEKLASTSPLANRELSRGIFLMKRSPVTVFTTNRSDTYDTSIKITKRDGKT